MSLIYLLRPIFEPDFFWHLKTGEWIFEHRGLPSTDPFSYTGAGVNTEAVRFTLTSYWLPQLLYFAVYTLGSWTGIVVLRIAAMALLLTVVWKRRQGDEVISLALLTIFAASFLEQTSIDRPQVLSFICFGALLIQLEGLRTAPENQQGRAPALHAIRGPLSLSLLMLAWANSHGGFLLGQAVIVIYCLAEGAKFIHRSLKPMSFKAYRALLTAGCAGLAASMVNPNGFYAMHVTFPEFGQGERSFIIEYLSMTEKFTAYKDYRMIVIWGLMLLAAVAILSRPKAVDITEVALLFACGVLAYRALRHIPFFTVVALPVIGRFLSQHGSLRLARAIAIGSGLALALVYAWDVRPEPWRLRTGDWVSRADFPVEAADFVAGSSLEGNMYNAYNWGGYLIWRLSPERKAFADGRNINNIHWQERVISLALEQPGQYGWATLFAKYGIEYAIIPPTEWGERQPLFQRLAHHPDWTLVFNSETAAVFAKTAMLRRIQAPHRDRPIR